MRQIVVAITGASGAVYARSLVRMLVRSACRVHVIVSPRGAQLMQMELGIEHVTAQALVECGSDRVVFHNYADMVDALASGSVNTDGMAVCPCSMHTLAEIATGMGSNLITRAAHVHLKQRRTLVLAPREMPLSVIDLENMLRAARAGAVIAPACPAFYSEPKSVQAVADFVASRVADCLGIHEEIEEFRSL